MGIKETVVLRIKKLCKEKGISPNNLATISGVTPSSIYSSFDPTRKDIGVILIKKLCDGFEITIDEFFDDDIFRGLEQEII